MSNITLPVGNTFQIPDARLLTDSDFVEDVLDSGVRVVNRLQDLETEYVMDARSKEVILKYQSDIDELISNHERNKQELVRFCKSKDDRISELELTICHLKEEIRDTTSKALQSGRDSGRKEMEDFVKRERQELEERKAELEKLKSQKEDYLTKILEEVRDDIGNVRNIFQKRRLSSCEIGEIGETFAEKWIKDNFNPADVRRVSSEPNSGDILFVYDEVHILIEVKNKNELRCEDLTKFHDDIITHKAKGHKYSAALLVSLPDVTLIKKWKTCYYETRNNMPVMYCGGILQSPILFTVAIHMLVKLAKSGHFDISTNSSDKKLQEDFKETALKYLKFVRSVCDDIIKDKKIASDLTTRIMTRESNLKEYLSHENEIFKHFPSIEAELQTLTPATVGIGTGMQTTTTRRKRKPPVIPI